ncbi:hypothetical protein SRHO_G00004540 [Serrasalmus rhombeus]
MSPTHIAGRRSREFRVFRAGADVFCGPESLLGGVTVLRRGVSHTPAHLGQVTRHCKLVMSWLRKLSMARNGNELARCP